MMLFLQNVWWAFIEWQARDRCSKDRYMEQDWIDRMKVKR